MLIVDIYMYIYIYTAICIIGVPFWKTHRLVTFAMNWKAKLFLYEFPHFHYRFRFYDEKRRKKRNTFYFCHFAISLIFGPWISTEKIKYQCFEPNLFPKIGFFSIVEPESKRYLQMSLKPKLSNSHSKSLYFLPFRNIREDF